MANARTPTDFASRSMLDMLVAGLRAQGVDLSTAAPGPARVPRAEKTTLLGSVVARHGFGVLLRIDAGLKAFEGRPVLEALLGGRGPWDVLERWGRLERYVHGRHRTRRTPLLPAGGGRHACRIEHHSLGARAPHALESLSVLSVLGALLRRAGAQNLQARIEGNDLYTATDDLLGTLVERGDALTWTYAWDTAAETPTSYREAADVFEAEAPIVREVARLVTTDLFRRWRLEDVAATLGLGERALQRSLSDARWRFMAVLSQARQAEAARQLRERDASLAEIGYLCGYADQAHFTRQFERDVGLTPGRYREAFRTPLP